MARFLELPAFSDPRGELCVLEKVVPFAVRRIYFIHHAQGSRGGHRHKKNIQLLIAVAGTVKINVHDGLEKKEFILKSPHQGLLLLASDWHTMDNFSRDCVLLVLASEPYEVHDYIDEPYPNP